MNPQTRLDSVVKLREKDEEAARLAMADAQRAAEAARQAAEEAHRKAMLDGRSRGLAADWELADSAHVRALREAGQADKAAAAAGQKLNTSRESYASAYKRAEVIRRVADARRAEIVAEADAVERKQLDEIGVLMYARG